MTKCGINITQFPVLLAGSMNIFVEGLFIAFGSKLHPRLKFCSWYNERLTKKHLFTLRIDVFGSLLNVSPSMMVMTTSLIFGPCWKPNKNTFFSIFGVEIIVWHLQIQSPPFCDVAKPCNASQARRVTWCNAFCFYLCDALSHDIWNMLWQTNLYFLFLLKPHQTAITAYFLKSREFWAKIEDRQINHSIRLRPQIITFISEKVGRKPITILDSRLDHEFE